MGIETDEALGVSYDAVPPAVAAALAGPAPAAHASKRIKA
jgi:hypothetical protein